PSLPTFLLSLPPPPHSTLFPYTTLFRSVHDDDLAVLMAQHRRLQRRHFFSRHDSSRATQYEPFTVIFNLDGQHDIHPDWEPLLIDRKSTRLNSSHGSISYAVFCLKKKKK